MVKLPILYVVIPCYNEEEVLPITSMLFLNKIEELIEKRKISCKSRIMFINDGSKDNTWELICDLAKQWTQNREHRCQLNPSYSRCITD